MTPDSTPASLDLLLTEARWLRRLARTLITDPDDAVQDTFLAAMMSPPATDRPVRPWLGQVLRNVARMRGRARGRAMRLEDSFARDRHPELPSPEELLALHEAQRLVAGAVSALNEPYRATILLHYSEGLTAAEIADRLGIPSATVRSRLKRGLDDIRQQLDRCYDGDRRAWCAALTPLGRSEPAPTTSLRPLTKALAGVGGATLLVTLVTAVAVSRPARQVADSSVVRPSNRSTASSSNTNAAPDSPPASPLDTQRRTTARGATSSTQMFAAAMAALAAASVRGSGRPGEPTLPRDQAISECVRIREAVFGCRDEYAAQTVEQYLARGRKVVPAAQRIAMEQKVREQAEREGAGPLPARSQLCGQMLNVLDKNGIRATAASAEAMRRCFENQPDCQTKIACLLAETANLASVAHP
jgi:RNA polymerase sigma factor (sigma-70 family)